MVRLAINGKRTLIVVAIAASSCACSGQGTNTGGTSTGGTSSTNPQTPQQPQSTAAPAQLQVEAPAQSGGSSANWGADKGAAPAKPPSFQRGRLLSQSGGGGGGGGGGNAPPVDPYLAQYPKWRLEKAAVIRNWAQVSVVPVGIDAFLKTAWTSGLIHIRLAMLGPLKNLHEFERTQSAVKITFQDRAGTALKTIIVPMSELKEAPNGVNFGTPTYVVEGSMDCSLEMYEEIYQWMFEWE